MSPFPKIVSILLMITFLLAAGCAPASPTDMVAPQSDPPAGEKPAPTETPAATVPPPTPVTPTDTPTPTSIPPTATPDVPFEKVTFTTEDGVNIAATLFGDGDLAVLLLHMGKGPATGNDQKDWHPFARVLADQGYAALTLDFRGRGDSGGDFVNGPVVLDTQSALEFLHERGFLRIVCIGAGLGGTTCMHLANEMVGIVVLSSTRQTGHQNNSVTEAELAQLTIPKFYLYGKRDGFGFPEAMQKIYQVSAGPKDLFTCDTAAHGSDLLNTPCGEDIKRQILTFLEDLE